MNDTATRKTHLLLVNGVVFKGNQALVSKRSFQEPQAPGKWTIPGGKVERTKKIVFHILEKTLQKEIKEETNITIKKNPWLITNNSFIRFTGQHVVALAFACEYQSGKPKPLEDTIACRWVTIQQVKKMKFAPSVKKCILEAFRKRKKGIRMKYNAALFGLYQNLFLVLKKEFGERKALELLQKIMERGLKQSYDQTKFIRGNPLDFARVVKARDQSVGLKVSVQATKNRIVYRFFTDPFPLLKGKVSSQKLGATHMKFKVNYLLGNQWAYRTTRHLWNRQPYTEFVIQKITEKRT